MNSADLEKRSDSLGKRIILDCLNKIEDGPKFVRMHSLIRRFLNENYNWLQEIDKETISTSLTKWAHSYIPPKLPKSPSELAGNRLSFFSKETRSEIFRLMIQNESEYMDSLDKTYSEYS